MGYPADICGRVFIKDSLSALIRNFAFAKPPNANELGEDRPRYNGAPRQWYAIIIREEEQPGAVFTMARWGLIPRWMKDEDGGPRPINAMSETLAQRPMLRSAYEVRRALLPIDGFFEWKAIKGQKAKQPYAIAMKDGSPFALAALYEDWRSPDTGESIRTFTVLTCPPNERVGEIHNRMPVMLQPKDYHRWIDCLEPDPRDLLVAFPAELMKVWPISRKVNSPVHDTPDILDEVPDGSI